MRTRRLRISAGGTIDANPRWIKPQIVFREPMNNKEVVLTIEDPWELIYLRNQLNKIAKHWQDSVKDL